MKLLEFLGTIRENAFNEPGKFVGARLTRDSERALMQWMRENGLRKKEPRARLHITVVGDKEQNFAWNPATFKPPLEIDPSSYKIEKFDDGAIVLSFSVPELEKRHEWAIKQYGIQWKYPTYQPHITLSYDPTGLNDTERLLTPTFPMYVANEYEHPWEFNESDSRSNRRRSTRIDEAFLTERNMMNASLVKTWAKNAADVMFGSERGAALLPLGVGDLVQSWAERALARYFINDMPASQIIDFEPDPVQQSDGKIEGRGKIVTPQDEAYGITSGNSSVRGIKVEPWVPAALARGDDVFYLDQRGVNGLVNSSAFGAVKDWFRHLANQAPERLKAGHLNRLTWEQAYQEAVEWHGSMRAGINDQGESEDDREIYLDMGNGVAWWKLTGETCLTREGDLMGHCAADYLHEVKSGNTTILSLRDAKNKPHVTVELNTGNGFGKPFSAIAQVKGKENEPPVEKYWKYVDELIKKLDSEGSKISVEGEGHEDLAGCGILHIDSMHGTGGMLIRTNKNLNEAEAWLRVIQYPQYVVGYEHLNDVENQYHEPLHEIMSILQNTYNIMKEADYDGEEDMITQWIKWLLIQNGNWEIDTETDMDNPDYDDDKHGAIDSTDDISPTIADVPTSIEVGLPGIKYEVLAGNPEENKFDLKYAIAMRRSNY